VEEAHCIRERILDEHALRVTRDKSFWGRVGVVGEQYGRLIVTEVRDEELAIGALKRAGLLFEEARVTIFAMWDIEFDGAPSRTGQQSNLLQQSGRPSTQGNEGNTHLVQTRQIRVGGQARIKNKMARLLTMSALPEGNEVEDLIGFFTFAQVGIGITEGAAGGILSQENQNAGLTSAASRYVMAFQDRMLSIIGDRMEIQIEGFSIKKLVRIDLLVPGGANIGVVLLWPTREEYSDK